MQEWVVLGTCFSTYKSKVTLIEHNCGPNYVQLILILTNEIF
jgi:hypothetical protein